MVHLESPHASRNDARMDETFEFLGRSAYLSSEDTDSTRDGSESLISFDDSAVDETSTQADPASHQDQASLDGDDSSDDSSIPEVVHTSLAQLEPQSDEPSAITTLSETQMFNSTLSTRTVTDSPIATDSENPENTLPGRKALLTGYKLDLTKPFHLLYHGPSSHRDIIIERIGQAIAASASTEIVTHEVTNSSRYCVMSVSFDDSHVALIPSTGLELIVTDAVGVCLFNQPKHRKLYTCQDQFDSLCPQGKTMPDLAVFLHHGSFDCVVKSSSCSTWMSELGVGVINLLEEPTKRTNMEDAIEVGLSLARDFEATKISERAEGFTTMTLNDFLDIDAASLNAEVASAVVLAAAKRPGKFSWMKPKAIKKHFNLLFSHFTDGCQWVADALNTGHSSLISASQSTLEHVKTRVPTELQFRIDLRRVAISMAIAACGFLMVHGLILGVLVTRFETRHHQYDPGFTTHLPSNTPPYVAAGCPAFTLAPNPELVSGKLSHLTSSKVLPEVESQIGSLLRQFSAHKTVASENLALQHVMLDNGTHLINLPSASFAGRKAPQVFVNATSSGKTVKVALNKLNSSSYELDLDLRAVKDLTRVLVWTHGTPSLNLNFTIHSNHSYQGLARLRRGFSLKSLLQSNTSKLIRYRSGKIVDSHFTVKPIVNNMKTFGHSAFMNLGKISKQLQDNANDLENSMAIPLMHGTARAVSTSKDALNKFGDNFARKTAKLAKDLKDIPKNVSPKLKGFSTVSSRPLYKAYAHARGFSKKLSSPKLSNAGIRETPKQVINSIKDLHGKMGARLTAFEKTMESKLDFINKGTAAIKKAIQEDGTRKSRIKSRVSGQKHGAHVESEKEATAGLKGFVARVVNMLPRH